MNTPKTLTLALMVISMAACGGAGPQATSTSPAVEMINGIVVPPDPGSAKDATLAGVDTDNNGIRDEIDRWIATKYGDKPGALEAIRMVARARQKLMVLSPTNQNDALKIAYEGMDVAGCVGDKLRQEGIVANQVFNESMIRTYNTPERMDARKKVFSLAGMIVRSVDDTTIVCPYEK